MKQFADSSSSAAVGNSWKKSDYGYQKYRGGAKIEITFFSGRRPVPESFEKMIEYGVIDHANTKNKVSRGNSGSFMR